VHEQRLAISEKSAGRNVDLAVTKKHGVGCDDTSRDVKAFVMLASTCHQAPRLAAQLEAAAR
jgi:hypothetical protein